MRTANPARPNSTPRRHTASKVTLLLALATAVGCGGSPADSAGTIDLGPKSRQAFDPKDMKKAAQNRAKTPAPPTASTP